ncbi:MAG: beta-propeller domain-containing protein [Clostridia bacterium]|nr:beta-propeller domain-containing protein [Clostridia bacterium]
MKKSELNKMLGLIDDDILNEARPSGKRKTKTSMWLKIVSVAACFLLIFNVVLVPCALYMNGKISSLEDELDGKDQIIENIQNGVGDPSHIQNVVQLPTQGDKNIILSSPLLSAPNKYKDIISSMIESSPYLDSSFLPGGNLGDAMDQTQEEIKDLENKEESSENLGGSESEGSSGSGDKYEETTDLQVKDVIEGDIIKRSSKYIYYLSGSKLKIYSINGKSSELVALYSLQKHIEALNAALSIPKQPASGDQLEEEKYETTDEILDDEYYSSNSVKEMFLSTDLTTITVILENRVSIENASGNLWDMDFGINDALYCTTLISLNIEDAENVYLNDITTVFGRYESARLLNGEFLLFTKYTPASNELVIPQYNDGEGFEYIPLENIYSPEEYVNGSYLVSYRINGESYDVDDVFAYASFDGEIYVTKNNIYITREYYEKSVIYGEYPIYASSESNVIVGYGEKTTTYKERVTDILRVSTENGVFEPIGVLNVDGYIKDRYSLHENGEYLYVVTTVSPIRANTIYKDLNGKIKYGLDDIIGIESTGTSASIYMADTSVMVLTSKLERFAPSGETVRSVRYDGATAYVCTSKQTMDPVFFFDLSDPFNITYTDTGTIPGFSTSLIDFGGDLLGIGVDAKWNFKLEAYRETCDSVESVCYYIINGDYSEEYKAYYVNREKGLIGLGICDYNNESPYRYVLIKYNGEKFIEVLNVELSGDLDLMRGVLIDNYFYIFSDKDFRVEHVAPNAII